jgi:hypothetical protein
MTDRGTTASFEAVDDGALIYREEISVERWD